MHFASKNVYVQVCTSMCAAALIQIDSSPSSSHTLNAYVQILSLLTALSQLIPHLQINTMRLVIEWLL